MSKFIELHKNEYVKLVNVDSIVVVEGMLDGVAILMPTSCDNLSWLYYDDSYEDVKKMLGVGE